MSYDGCTDARLSIAAAAAAAAAIGVASYGALAALGYVLDY